MRIGEEMSLIRRAHPPRRMGAKGVHLKWARCIFFASSPLLFFSSRRTGSNHDTSHRLSNV
jgi:hypothetical protein